MSTNSTTGNIVPPPTIGAFDLAHYHQLAKDKKRPLVAKTHLPLPARDLWTTLVREIPAEYYVRVGVHIPGTNAYQVTAADNPFFDLRVEDVHLVTCLVGTDETLLLENEDSDDEETAFDDFWGHSMLFSSVALQYRTIGGKPVLAPLGLAIHVGEARHLPGYAILTPHLAAGVSEDARVFIAITHQELQYNLNQRHFGYAAGRGVEWAYNGGIDLTFGGFTTNVIHRSQVDFVGCGTKCEAVRISTSQVFKVIGRGGETPLAWCCTATGVNFVVDIQVLNRNTQVDCDVDALTQTQGVRDWPDQKSEDLCKAAGEALVADTPHPLTWNDEEYCHACKGYFKQHRDDCQRAE